MASQGKDRLQKYGLRAEKSNRDLLENVHPADWNNPSPSGRYNLVVIGAGTAGLVTAAGAAGLGAKVALIEKGLMGGDCLNVGCVPSKGLIRGSRAISEVRGSREFGVTGTEGVGIDFQTVARRMRSLRAKISPHDSAKRFSELGVDVYFGSGVFRSPTAVEVDGQKLSFSKAVIATGGRPRIPEIEGIENIAFHTNETIFELDELPKSLLVLGAGPIGVEMAQAFQRLGSQVTLVTHGSQIMSKEDPDVAALIENGLQAEGVKIVTAVEPARFTQKGEKTVLTVTDRDSKAIDLEAEEVLLSVGRIPNVESMGLEAAGVQTDAKGVCVNDRLQTTAASIYAAGDVASSFKFTHAAEAYARIVIQNALFFGRKKASDLHIPWTTYTDPEVSHVGIHARDAEKDPNINTITLPFKKNDRAILDGDTRGLIRVHYHARKGSILGATIVAKHAGDMIGEVVLAMNQGASVGSLANTIHPYPTQADMIRQVGNEFQRGRLSPTIRKVLKAFFRWRR